MNKAVAGEKKAIIRQLVICMVQTWLRMTYL